MKDEYILVVDDDEAIRESLGEVLEDENHVVQLVQNGKEALELLRRRSAPCLMLLDLMMPIMNGWDLVKELHRDPELAKIPICVISAAGPHLPPPREAVAVVPKPVVLEDLLRVVNQHC